jgi:hypothetical protein
VQHATTKFCQGLLLQPEGPGLRLELGEVLQSKTGGAPMLEVLILSPVSDFSILRTDVLHIVPQEGRGAPPENKRKVAIDIA